MLRSANGSSSSPAPRFRRRPPVLECVAKFTLSAAAPGCNRGAELEPQVEATLQRTLAAQARPPYVTADAEGKKLWKLTQQFYERRSHTPAWIKGTAPLPQISELIAALQTAG